MSGLYRLTRSPQWPWVFLCGGCVCEISSPSCVYASSITTCWVSRFRCHNGNLQRFASNISSARLATTTFQRPSGLADSVWRFCKLNLPQPTFLNIYVFSSLYQTNSLQTFTKVYVFGWHPRVYKMHKNQCFIVFCDFVNAISPSSVYKSLQSLHFFPSPSRITSLEKFTRFTVARKMIVHTPQTMCKLKPPHIYLEKLTKIVSFCGRGCVTHIPLLWFEKLTKGCGCLVSPPVKPICKVLFDVCIFRGGTTVSVHCVMTWWQCNDFFPKTCECNNATASLRKEHLESCRRLSSLWPSKLLTRFKA